MHPLFTSSFRKHTLIIAFIVAIPAVVFLVYVEYGLNKLDTHYLKKRIDFERQLNSIEILTLGSSNAYFGINPAQFSCTGYSLAFNAQSMYYDLEFVKKYLPLMPNLKVVVLPAIFYTTGSKLIGTSQDWRIYFYKQYFGLPNESVPGDMTGNIKRFIDSRNYTKIALYGNTVYYHVKQRFSGHVDYIPESNGWYDSKDVPKLTDKNNTGINGAISHSKTYDTDVAKINIEYWQEIISLLNEKKVNILIIRLPEDSSYYNNLEGQKSKLFTDSITELAQKNGIVFADYSKDSRFGPKDFTLMSDHLNPEGASTFSKILNEDYLDKYCR